MTYGAASINPGGATLTWFTSVNGDTTETSNGPEFAGVAVPFACTARSLEVSARYVSGTGTDNITVTLMVNGVATAMTCGFSATTAGTTYTASSTTFVTLSAGDILALRYTQDNSTPIIRIGTGLTCS